MLRFFEIFRSVFRRSFVILAQGFCNGIDMIEYELLCVGGKQNGNIFTVLTDSFFCKNADLGPPVCRRSSLLVVGKLDRFQKSLFQKPSVDLGGRYLFGRFLVDQLIQPSGDLTYGNRILGSPKLGASDSLTERGIMVL